MDPDSMDPDSTHEEPTGQVPMVRQGELVGEIALAVSRSAAAGGDWESATLRVRRLAPYGETTMAVARPSGEDRSVLPDRSVGRLVRDLRDVMYRPGAGTWLSMELTVRRDDGHGKVDVAFNYDDRPAWSDAPKPHLYAKDLHKYPRTLDHTPRWLREELAAARH
ncbi:hypothetical protein [Myceligenerans pegani]|uniref:Polyketide cyclase n=1 Tax=Myceligenerans pegani TaxID=2776917 RepID=A0ABR9N087_9MICO|nr:hypothetical protein [Myceligenerans sp. TRM 65318]MBE1877068.1 hypothetical protein [Myceligenerans sp. TRM 65318]MBE3019339.1 hypothetical protein [Myceligenerans sp. TRM 65318]